jgi:myo-inositol 2-dehydrogenase/D-chiro-inositol 1-dehydrogenase
MTDLAQTSEPSGASRRDFLKASTAAVVSGSLAAQLAVPGNVYAQGSDVVKIGLIGCGGRGSGAAVDAMRCAKVPVKLVAMGDAFQFRMDGSMQSIKREMEIHKVPADRFDVSKEKMFTGLDAYKKVIEAGVDLVILTTPPGFRPQHFEAAVKAGKHVFMEKPVAVDAPGVRKVLEATAMAKQKKLGVGVGLQRRHQNTYLETVKRLQDGMIGDIHTLRVYWNGTTPWVRHRDPNRHKTEMQYQVDNWYFFNWLSGDHICEQHIHNLDVGNWVKGAYPEKAQGMGGREVRKEKDTGEIFDHHAVEFVYADGARMFSYCRHMDGCWPQISEHAQGSKGKADISAARIEVGKDVPWRYRGPTNGPYQTEHEDLLESIRKGTPINEGEYGAMSSMTAILGRMCTYSGKEITMKDALASGLRLGPEDGFTWDTTPPVPKVAVPGVTEVLAVTR